MAMMILGSSSAIIASAIGAGGLSQGYEVMGLVFHFGSAYGRISVLDSAVRRPTGGM
jgi:hypothetical protein